MTLKKSPNAVIYNEQGDTMIISFAQLALLGSSWYNKAMDLKDTHC